MLTILEHVPDGFIECSSNELHTVLPGPTLMHLPGERREPLFVSTLLHGNESSGLQAVQKLLHKYRGKPLPRALSVFIGNVHAAREGRRHLDGQPDYNRIWPHAGEQTRPTAEHAMMRQIVEIMRERNVFASIDVHNNTGFNPHYGCINRLDKDFLHLATLFSRTVVYFIRPEGVQSMAFADLCPSVTVECGKPDQPRGAEHAREFLDTVLHLSHFPGHPRPEQDFDIFHTVATVYVPETFSIGFGDEPADIRFPDDLDRLNFNELPVGTLLGRVDGALNHLPLSVIDEAGQSVGEHYFRIEDGEITTTVPVMPSMFTLDKNVIRQDCLGYLMERVRLD